MNEKYKCSRCNGTGKGYSFSYSDHIAYCWCSLVTEKCVHPDRHENCKLVESKTNCKLCDGTGKVDWLTNIFHNNYNLEKPKLVGYKNIIDLKEKNRCIF